MIDTEKAAFTDVLTLSPALSSLDIDLVSTLSPPKTAKPCLFILQGQMSILGVCVQRACPGGCIQVQLPLEFVIISFKGTLMNGFL